MANNNENPLNIHDDPQISQNKNQDCLLFFKKLQIQK
jgi:hypothetical protein